MQVRNKTYTYLDGSKLKGCIVAARWNSEITDNLLKEVFQTLKKCKMLEKNIRVIRVAGSVELPFALHKLASTKKYDFLVALGCIIRGETPHFDYVCKIAQEGVLEVMLEDDVPVGFGVLTVNNIKQARKRIHVGGEAALAALELASLK
ncbi:6,7-dimethyl-8-ribityllumazine synthase [Candidatus Nomurabacteria bacterium]|nr:6,7-dimethyl-8-ribityllumazine synthase [Candidatus Nomurabacteria bacterium]